MDVGLLLGIILVLVVVGFGLYFLNTRVTAMDNTIKMIINFIVIMAVVLWLLSVFLGITPRIS